MQSRIFKIEYFYFSFFLLLLLNLYTTYSSTYFSDFEYLIKQGFFIIFSFFINSILYFYILHRKQDYFKRIDIFYNVNVFLLSIGLIFSIALFFLPASIVPYINGATRWIKTPFFNIAPIEVLKIGVIFLFTHILTSNIYTNNFHSKTLKVFLPFAFVFFILAILIPFKQKDLGNFFLILISFLSIIFILFNRIRLIFKLFFVGFIGLTLFIISSPHRIDRIKNWINASQQTGDISSNYQVVQGLFAINSSNVIGNGVGESIFKLGYIPDLHTDMIFTLLIDETGVFGLIFYYTLIFYITFYIVYQAMRINNLYTILYTLIVSLMVFYQGFINLFGILGVIPLKGISVPFLSYGGSNIFYIITIFSFAIILLKINSEKTIYKL